MLFAIKLVSRLVGASLSSDGMYERVALFSGHDTVIAPVLASLGVYRDNLCRWPPYASRIIFELWQPVASLNNGVSISANSVIRDRSRHAMPPEALTALSEKNAGLYLLRTANTSALLALNRDELVSYFNSFVRVIFNGRDITKLIPQCAEERAKVSDNSISADSSDSSEDVNDDILSDLEQTRHKLITKLIQSSSSLCSIEALAKQVKGMLGMHDNLESACK